LLFSSIPFWLSFSTNLIRLPPVFSFPFLSSFLSPEVFFFPDSAEGPNSPGDSTSTVSFSFRPLDTVLAVQLFEGSPFRVLPRAFSKEEFSFSLFIALQEVTLKSLPENFHSPSPTFLAFGFLFFSRFLFRNTPRFPVFSS